MEHPPLIHFEDESGYTYGWCVIYLPSIVEHGIVAQRRSQRVVGLFSVACSISLTQGRDASPVTSPKLLLCGGMRMSRCKGSPPNVTGP